MPKFPDFSSRVTDVGGSVFERFKAKMTAHGQELIKLHIGDTCLPPKYELPFDPEFLHSNPTFNQYCNTYGIDLFRQTLCDKLHEDNALNCQVDNIQVTCGSTNALSATVQAFVAPGDEVLVLTPAWPFFFGMVRIAGGRVIEAPFYFRLFEDPDLDIETYLAPFISARTIAIYLNTPNNPSAKVMTRRQLQQVAKIACSNNLWVISDEAYDGLTFDARPHISIASLPGMFERTITVFTFSKAFMFAGLRLGYAVADEGVIVNVNKMLVHQLYSASTVVQQMMIEPVLRRHTWLQDMRKDFQALRDIAIQHLEIEFPKPEGTYFVMFPIENYLRGRDYWQIVETCLDAGISVAPGDSFGSHFTRYIRLCFTGETPERLAQGIKRLNDILLRS